MAIQEFTSNAQALFYIFLMGFWITFLYLTFTLKGDNGKSIGFLNIMQMVFGIVLGLKLIEFTFLIGFTSMLVAVGVFVGKMVYNGRG